ncbi:MerR family transcriptional regulator [Clostridium bornimense]|uniref:MerR family transcriptional regulator n=1 Tax=Clostridium bornimense TaxID=1216932 RepID=W6S0E9_9CLOT|nr:MerR family transcriptional regulator [Clostridium bornimense]CDM70228.1 MerR family transcriptional regulator [Clostridium bornimense]
MNEEYVCEKKEDVTLYKIGLFSQMNKITIKALRHYDEIGLLKPEHIDEFTGYRYYSSAQLPILHEIIALRQIGFSLEEIRDVQAGKSVKELLVKKKSEILKKISEETMKLSQVEYYLENRDEDCKYDIVLKDLPEVIVASMRTTISSYEDLFKIIPPMGAEMERVGCICAVPEYCFNIYHDGEYRERDIDVEVCEAVVEMKEDSKLIKFKKIDKVELAACTLHKGSYSDFPKAYSALIKWIEENDYEMIDYPRESYIDGVWNKDSEEEWLTEIQFPVRKK